MGFWAVADPENKKIPAVATRTTHTCNLKRFIPFLLMRKSSTIIGTDLYGIYIRAALNPPYHGSIRARCGKMRGKNQSVPETGNPGNGKWLYYGFTQNF